MEEDKIIDFYNNDISNLSIDPNMEYTRVSLISVTNVNKIKIKFKSVKMLLLTNTDLSIFDYNNDKNIVFGDPTFRAISIMNYEENVNKIAKNYSLTFKENVKIVNIRKYEFKSLSFIGQERITLFDSIINNNTVFDHCSIIQFKNMSINNKFKFIDAKTLTVYFNNMEYKEDSKNNVIDIDGNFNNLEITGDQQFYYNFRINLNRTQIKQLFLIENIDFNSFQDKYLNLGIEKFICKKCKNVSNFNFKFPNLTNLTLDNIIDETFISNFSNLNSLIGNSKLKEISLANFNFNVITFDREKFPNLINLEKLIINKCKIRRIFGLEFFENLTFLSLSYNELDICPELPTKINYLNLNNNFITEMCDLNFESLKKLYISNNKLHIFPQFPDNLEILNCGNNPININKLKDTDYNLILPSNLKNLNLNNLNLYEIDELPLSIQSFDCSYNNLTSIGTRNLRKYKNLTYLNCSYNNIDKLPKLPEKLDTLICNNNRLRKINISEDLNLMDLDCSHNNIEGVLNLSGNISYVDASYNNIIDVVSKNPINHIDISHNKLTKPPQNIDKNTLLNLNYNQITTSDGLEKLIYFCKSDIEGNPIEDTVFPEGINSKLTFFSLERRRFNPSKSIDSKTSPEIVDITTVPKGTVLFRGYFGDAPSYSALNDLIGFPMGDGNHRVIPYTNVFFYGAPFVSEKILGTPTFEIIFVLTKDIKVIHGLLPSLNYRSERYTSKYLINCDEAEYKNFKGNWYDPCISEEFIKQNPDVVGSIFLAEQDVGAHKCTKGEDIEYEKYRRFFNDVLNTGVPEFILTPSLERTMKEKVTNIKDVTKDWLIEHKNDFNYYPLYFVKDKATMKETVDALLSPQGYKDEDRTFGFDTLHMSIDKETKLYVIEELVDENVKKRLVPRNEENKLNYL